jgi:hypothetical protein
MIASVRRVGEVGSYDEWLLNLDLRGMEFVTNRGTDSKMLGEKYALIEIE